MRRFAMILTTVAFSGLWAMPLAAQGNKDDVKKDGVKKDNVKKGQELPAEGDAKAREDKIKALAEQVLNLHKQLEEIGVKGPDLKAARPPLLPSPEEMQRDLRERMRAGILGEGIGLGGFPGGLPGGHPNTGPFGQRGGDPNSIMLQHLGRMMEIGEPGGLAGAGDENDPIEMGRRMVITGLEVQLRGVAERIRSTEDKEAKEELTDELKEMVARIVEARKKHRDKSIERLEKRLETIRKQEIESADAILKRLLEGESSPKTPPDKK